MERGIYSAGVRESQTRRCDSPSPLSLAEGGLSMNLLATNPRLILTTRSLLAGGSCRGKPVDGRVNFAAHGDAFLRVQIVLELQLHHRFQAGNLQEDRPAIGEQLRGADIERVMPFLLRIVDGPVFRAVLRGVAIVPLSDSVAAGVF